MRGLAERCFRARLRATRKRERPRRTARRVRSVPGIAGRERVGCGLRSKRLRVRSRPVPADKGRRACRAGINRQAHGACRRASPADAAKQVSRRGRADVLGGRTRGSRNQESRRIGRRRNHCIGRGRATGVVADARPHGHRAGRSVPVGREALARVRCRGGRSVRRRPGDIRVRLAEGDDAVHLGGNAPRHVATGDRHHGRCTSGRRRRRR